MGWTGSGKERKGQAGVTECGLSGVEVTGTEAVWRAQVVSMPQVLFDLWS